MRASENGRDENMKREDIRGELVHTHRDADTKHEDLRLLQKKRSLMVVMFRTVPGLHLSLSAVLSGNKSKQY